MKLFKAVAAMACAVALSGAAQAATYSDSSANYELNHDLATGDNGGTGFGAWEIEKHGSGDGWAGCGIWDPSANNFQGDWAGKTQAFGIIGKGDSYGVNAYRPFRAPLAVGDSFSLEMGVNWDPNSGIDALKGFALLAKNGTYQALTINHRSNPGNIAINGNVDSEILNAFGTYPMKWTFTAKDESTLTVTATPRDGSETIYEQDWEVETSAIDGFRLQSSGQNPYEDGAAAEAQGETAQMWADRRQTYFDNFTLEIAAELPELVDLSIVEDNESWAITSADPTALSFTLTRSSSVGEATVAISSSDPSFVALSSDTVTFADGEATVKFTGTATLSGGGQVASVTASGTGFNPPESPWDVKGPAYECDTWDSTKEEHWWTLWAGETRSFFYVNNRQASWFPGSDAKVTVASADESVATVAPAQDWQTDEGDGHTYASWTVTGVAAGKTAVEVLYDGVKVSEYEFTVQQDSFTLEGPTAAGTGTTETYTLSGNFQAGFSDATISVSAGSVTPEYVEEIANGDTCELTVTFPDEAGKVVLTVRNANEVTASLTVTVTAPVDPSIFDDYVAYDDASLYEAGFDFTATGAGQEGFQAWSVFKDSAEFGNAIITGADGGFPAILTGEKAFAIYANGNSPDYAIYRPFVNDLQPGQKASIEFVVPENPGSALYVQFARVWDGYPYSRFEIWANNDGLGVNVDGAADESKALSWSKNARRIVASVQRAADGSSYELRLSGFNEGSEFVDDIYVHVVNADVGSWGEGIQGIAVGGYDLATDCIFNKLVIEQVEEPVKVRTIGIMGTWNMDATGDYDFAVGPAEAGDPIGTVALAVTPDDGRVVLSTASVDVPGDDVAAFTVTVTSVPGEGEEAITYTITATPADESIPAADFNLTPIRPNLWLATENWEHSTDEDSIWLSLNATPSFYGTYAITSEDDSILSVPESSASITVDEGQTQAWFDVKIEGPGVAKIFATLGEKVAEYGFTINPGVDPDVELPAPVFVKGKGLAWDASILDNGFVLRGTDTLGESPDKNSWSDLVEGTDYVVEEGTVTVLYTSAYNYIALLKK